MWSEPLCVTMQAVGICSCEHSQGNLNIPSLYNVQCPLNIASNTLTFPEPSQSVQCKCISFHSSIQNYLGKKCIMATSVSFKNMQSYALK